MPISHTGFNQQQSFFHEKLEKPDTPYLVYMGGDTNTTFVTINNNTGRNLMILKDSFGNVVPPNLFYGFDTITVIDYRYFTDPNLPPIEIDNEWVKLWNEVFQLFNKDKTVEIEIPSKLLAKLI